MQYLSNCILETDILLLLDNQKETYLTHILYRNVLSCCVIDIVIILFEPVTKLYISSLYP